MGWDSKSNKMIFIGYEETTKSYRLIDSKTRKITKSRNVIFMKNRETHIKNTDRENKKKSKVIFAETDKELEEDRISVIQISVIQSEDEFEDVIELNDSIENTEPKSSIHQQTKDSRKRRSTK